MAEEFHSGICSGSWWNSLKSTGVDGLSTVSVPVPSVARSTDIVGYGWTGTGVSDDKQRSCDHESISGSSVSFQYDNQKVVSLPMVTGGGFMMDPSLPVTGFGLSSPMDWNQALINSGGRANDQTSFHESFYNQESKASMDSNHIHMGTINVENTTPNLFKDINNFQAFMADQQHHLSSGNESTDSVSFPENLSVSYGSPSPVFLQGLPLDQSPQQHGYANNSYNQIASSEMVMNFNPNPNPSPNWSTKIPQFSNNTPFWNAPLQTQFLPHKNFESKPNATTMPTKTSSEGVRDSSSVTKKGSSEPAFKKPRVETPSPLPTFKVRKEKLSDRVTALQQLVSPFGKTDTASVLYEAIDYIKFLHDQVNVLSTQYLKNGHPMQQHQQNPDKSRDGEGPKQDLRSRGLCLVPISSTFPVANEPISDFWTPSFGGYYR